MVVERELVARAVAGDHEAFEVLAHESSASLYAVAWLILRDRDRAQDAVQEALITAWRDIRGLHLPDAWVPWIRRLTVRACYRTAERDRRRRTAEMRSLALATPGSWRDDVSALGEHDAIVRVLGTLPLDQRAVLVVHFYLDLPINQAAVVLGIPVGTCKSRLARGLEALRAALEPVQDAGVGSFPEVLR
jgi:RNA polymerase sigma-70 factor (ECF subfamily)